MPRSILRRTVLGGLGRGLRLQDLPAGAAGRDQAGRAEALYLVARRLEPVRIGHRSPREVSRLDRGESIREAVARSNAAVPALRRRDGSPAVVASRQENRAGHRSTVHPDTPPVRPAGDLDDGDLVRFADRDSPSAPPRTAVRRALLQPRSREPTRWSAPRRDPPGATRRLRSCPSPTRRRPPTLRRDRARRAGLPPAGALRRYRRPACGRRCRHRSTPARRSSWLRSRPPTVRSTAPGTRRGQPRERKEDDARGGPSLQTTGHSGHRRRVTSQPPSTE